MATASANYSDEHERVAAGDIYEVGCLIATALAWA